MEKSELLTLRTTEEAQRMLEKLTMLENRKATDEARLVLDIGMRERLKELALRKYSKGNITLEKAAEIAEISVWEMAELLSEKKIAFKLDVDAVIEATK
ncbi:MAG: UPF0175 family protein [Candidatus Aenigmarchaeota archaeon]|nr:UPF0175 family protein [Candidatus Aenigmarchaeota archaeon]